VRKKPEIRNPKSETNSNSQIPISIFDFVSNFEFRVSNFIQTISLILLLLFICSCRRDMFNQPSTQPLSRNDFFQDNQMASRPVVMHTVARDHLDEDEAFYTGKIGTNLVTTFPLPVTREVLERGRERFEIYCSVCHGRTGEGNGMIVQRGFPVPPSYHIDRLRQAPVGHFFDVMTQGYGIMYSYAERVRPEDRWAIAAYIRALQLSHNMKLAELPPTERAQLEGSK
jgi:cytochrome c553